MTGVEKKRLVWIVVAIVFFFANLTLMTVLVINALTARKPAPVSSMPAGSQPAEAPR